MTSTFLIKKISTYAQVPEYKTAGAAGLDLAYAGETGIGLPPNQVILVPTGLAFAIPEGWEGQVRPRSGFSTKNRIIMPNAPGTIDSDYRGEVFVPLLNLAEEDFFLEPGVRIAQLVLQKVDRLEPVLVTELPESLRGSGGFGSTGK